MARLSGTGRIADDVYLLAHSDVTGRPYLQQRPLGLGLAGGLLAELVLVGTIRLGPGHQVTGAGGRPPEDELARHVLGVVAGEQEARPVADWLLYLARSAAAGVGDRLSACGYLAHKSQWWRGGRWVPTDRDSAFAPVLRVRAALDASRPLTIHDAVLAGLADACGLGFRLAAYAPARPLRPLHHAVAQLAPSLQELIAQTRTAVDSAVLAPRL